MRSIVMVAVMLVVVGVAAAETSAPVIGPTDQQKLTTALGQLRQAEAVKSQAETNWRAVMYEAMANAKASPQEFLMVLEGEQFVLKAKPTPRK